MEILVMRSLGYSALLGWLVRFILNSSVSNQTESQADISHAHARVPRRNRHDFSQVSWAHDLDTSSSLVRILGNTQHGVVLILDEGSGTRKDLDAEYW